MRRWLLPTLFIPALLVLTACNHQPPPPYPGGTVSKLVVNDEQVGTGPLAEPGMELAVQYTGWLYEEKAKDKRGKKFDSTFDHGGQPFQFTLGTGHVIKGWDQGLKGMRVGGVRVIMIPPDLAYGSRGAGGGMIPPNASLVFKVRLITAKTP